MMCPDQRVEVPFDGDTAEGRSDGGVVLRV